MGAGRLAVGASKRRSNRCRSSLPRELPAVAGNLPGVSEADIAVVGAGIVGLAVARELARREARRRVVVLEREDRVGMHQTGHNSGVAHAGIYYSPGSLKARLCVNGARELAEYCKTRGLPYERCGKLIVALEARELRALEPHAAGMAALHSPATAIVDFAAVARSFADDLRGAGSEIVLGAAVEGVEVRPGGGAQPSAGRGVRTTASATESPPAAGDSSPGVAGGDSSPGAAAGDSSRRVAPGASPRRIVLRHSRGELVAGFAVFCGGAWS